MVIDWILPAGVSVLLLEARVSSQGTAEVLKAVAAILAAVAWPVVALIVVRLFRSSIGSLIDELYEVGAGKIFARKRTVPEQPQEPPEVVPTPLAPAGLAPGGLPAAVAPAAAANLEEPAVAPLEIPESELPIDARAADLRRTLVQTLRAFPKVPERQAYLLDAAAIFGGNYEHERDYRLIFGSQLTLLQLAAVSVVRHDVARQLYERSSAAKIAPTYPFENWIGFLTRSAETLEEVRQPEAGFRLTGKGRAFLGYLASVGAPLEKPM